MAFRGVLYFLAVIWALSPMAAEARVATAPLMVSDDAVGSVEVKGGKRLNMRPAPRQRAQRGNQFKRRSINRAPKRQLAKRPSRQIQKRAAPVRRATGITGRKAAPVRAAPKAKAARVPQVKQRLSQIRKALPTPKAAKAATPTKAKPLTKARLAAVSKSLKSAGKQVKYDKSLKGHQTIAGGKKAYDQVPKQYRDQVKGSFQGDVRAIKLTRPMVVQRRYGGDAKESGSPYYTRQSYASRALSKVRLALPRGNKANLKTTHILPKGSVILVGRAAPQKAGGVFGVNAKGGGEQIYVVNPKAAKSLKLTGGLRP